VEFKIRPNRMKRKILAGEDHRWLLLDFMSVELVEIIGTLGFDYIMIEGEHGALNEDRIQDLVRAAERYDMTPCIRLQEIYPDQIGRLLDIGIQGIHFCHARNGADVERFVRAAKYPPLGDRGFGRFSRLNAFGLSDEAEAIKAGNEELFLSIAIEDIEGANNIEEICATPGLDHIGIGSSDLSASMGIPGQYDNPEFQRVFRKVKETIRASQYGHPEGRRIGGSANLLIAQCMREVHAGTRTMNVFKGLNDPSKPGI